MQLNTIFELKKDTKMHNYLRENSEWYKLLNRSAYNYDVYVKAMKKKYRLNITDKISDTIENVDMIASIINTVKE